MPTRSRPARRTLLPLLVTLALLASVAVAPAAPADQGPCAPIDPALAVTGTVTGEDGSYVNAQISLALENAAGQLIRMDGCPATVPGYSAVLPVNPSMPGSGSHDDGGGAYTTEWSLVGLPANATHVWLEVYSKRTWPERQGPGDGRFSGVHLGRTPVDRPLHAVLALHHSEGGTTGSLEATVTYDAQLVRPAWISAWATEPAEPGGPLGFGSDYVRVGPSFEYPTLASGRYQVWASFLGEVIRVFGVEVATGQQATVHFGFGRFGDVAVTHPFWAEISWALREGAIRPDTDLFEPVRTVDRLEAVAALWELEGRPTGAPPAPFSDLDGLEPDERAAIDWAAAAGITTGFPDGTFRPHAGLTRQAAAAFLHRLAGTPAAPGTSGFSDIPPGHPFAEAVAWMAASGITVGFPDGTFGAVRELRRQAYAAFLHRFHGEPDPTLLDPHPIADVAPQDPDHPTIWWALSSDLLRFGPEGPHEGGFMPDHGIRRRDVLRALHLDAGYPVPPTPPGYPDPGYCDVTFTSFHWLQITWAAATGITEPEACFRPLEPATRADALGWLWRYLGAPGEAGPTGYLDVDGAHPLAPALRWAVEAGIVPPGNGDASFGPDDAVTRRELAHWLHGTLA